MPMTRLLLGLSLLSAIAQGAGAAEGEPVRLYTIHKNRKWGYIDASGKVAIEPQFERAAPFSEGLAHVWTATHSGFINQTGEFVFRIPLRRGTHGDPFAEGMAWFSSVQKYAYVKYGYVNKAGEIVIKAQFDEARSFSEGLAAVRVGKKWGFIDRAGALVIKPRLEHASEFHGGLAVFFTRYCTADQQCGYIDKTGKVVIEPQFQWAGRFAGGLAAVTSGARYAHRGPAAFVGGTWKYIDKTGKPAFGREFKGAQEFSEGLGCVEINGRWGYINREGKVVIEPRFGTADIFSEGLAFVRVNGKCGYIDKRGVMAFHVHPQPRYYRFKNGLAEVCGGGYGGYIDKRGKYVWRRWRPPTPGR